MVPSYWEASSISMKVRTEAAKKGHVEISKRPLALVASAIPVGIMIVGALLIGAAFLAPSDQPKVPFKISRTDQVDRLLKTDPPDLPKGASAQSYAINVEDIGSPIAEFVTLEEGGRPSAVLNWTNKTPESVLSPDVSIREIRNAAKAISKYTQPDDILIGFPGFVMAVAKLSNRPTLIDSGAPFPVVVPEIWEQERSAIIGDLQKFWGTDAAEAVKLGKVTEALLSDELAGTAALAALANGRRAFLVLHIGDVLRLGAYAPDRFRIGYRDFAGGSRSHGLIKAVKTWLSKEGHTSYAVEQREGNYSRIYFLGEDKLQKTLIARALPFSTTNPMELGVLPLVYQTGGTWIFRVNSFKPAAKSAPNKPRG